MLWPFNQFRKPRLAPAGTIEAIYGMIVTQAREPVFYRDMGVPDTVNGRFDMILLHLWLVLRRLRTVRRRELSQGLFDHFCEDMDDNLREMGVGDLTVPKQMRAFGEAFYGRAKAYDAALDDRRRGAGAGDLQEYLEWHRNRPGAAARGLCAGHRWRISAGPMRCAAGRPSNFPRRLGTQAMSRPNDRPRARPLARARDGRANSRYRPASRARGIGRRAAGAWPRLAVCARCCRPTPISTSCRRAAAASRSRATSGPGSARPAWYARSDRERNR